jgi:hypothetical protein
MKMSLFAGEAVAGVGDVAVTTASATAWENPYYAFVETPTIGPAASGNYVVRCAATITNFWAASCFHNNLPTNGQVVAKVIAELRALESSWQPSTAPPTTTPPTTAPPTTTPPTQQTPAPFALTGSSPTSGPADGGTLIVISRVRPQLREQRSHESSPARRQPNVAPKLHGYLGQ